MPQEDSEIMRAIGRLEGKMDGVVNAVESHGKSISDLQQAETYRKGQSAIISFMVSTAISLAGIFYKR